MSEENPAARSATSPADGLWSRLSLIEGQPLEDRAVAYAALHDNLTKRLESAPRESAQREASSRELGAPSSTPSPAQVRPGTR